MNDADDGDSFLVLEYQECTAANRSITAIRFSFFGSFIVFFTILITGYHYVRVAKITFGELHPYVLLAIAIFGSAVSFVGWLMEQRNTLLNRVCVERAKTLEHRMDTVQTRHEGKGAKIHELLDSSEAKLSGLGITATHTMAIRIMYLTIGGIWFVLFIYSAHEVISR